MRVIAVLALLVSAAPALGAQSLLYRAPDLGGTWTPDGGVVQFNFLHRFYVSPGPAHAVVNYPTFTLALGLGGRAALGARFATRSPAGTGAGAQSTNETETYMRWRPLGREGAPGLTVAVTPAYSWLAHSAAGELSADWTRGPVTLQGAVRGVSRRLGRRGDAAAALAGGLVARLNSYIAVSANLGSFVSPAGRAAWSAALDFLIPGSPHTFSLQASNAASATLQGASQGVTAADGSNQILYGFEFTIPLHLKRFAPWFRRAPTPASVGPVPPGTPAAEVRLANFRFDRDSVTVAAGALVRWTNTDPVAHTVTFEADESGSPLIPTNGSYVRRFDRPGRYAYHCTPHPFMKGVVVVR